MSAQIAKQYQRYDAFLGAHSEHPTGGLMADRDWADVIFGADPNIQALGVVDSADADGLHGDAYWIVHYYTGTEAVSPATLESVFRRILDTANSAGVTVRQAMLNWGLPLPPCCPIIPASGRNWASNIEAQQTDAKSRLNSRAAKLE
jgi:hypothetical protein